MEENKLIKFESDALQKVGNTIAITNKLLKESLKDLVIEYKSVKIGDQIWMTENLNVDCYRNGDPIPQVTNRKDWETLTTGAWCHYNNNPIYENRYGKLYNWYAVNDPRGLSPLGWHLPIEKEWKILKDNLGGESVAGGAMKSVTKWKGEMANGSNSSGFNGLPGGWRHAGFSFDFLGDETVGYWWSNSEWGKSLAWYYSLCSKDSNLKRLYSNKYLGFYVRCIKD